MNEMDLKTRSEYQKEQIEKHFTTQPAVLNWSKNPTKIKVWLERLNECQATNAVITFRIRDVSTFSKHEVVERYRIYNRLDETKPDVVISWVSKVTLVSGEELEFHFRNQGLVDGFFNTIDELI